ncbi:hypothetical protein KIPB_010321, partial [Kipferlia bialata]
LFYIGGDAERAIPPTMTAEELRQSLIADWPGEGEGPKRGKDIRLVRSGHMLNDDSVVYEASRDRMPTVIHVAVRPSDTFSGGATTQASGGGGTLI